MVYTINTLKIFLLSVRQLCGNGACVKGSNMGFLEFTRVVIAGPWHIVRQPQFIYVHIYIYMLH